MENWMENDGELTMSLCHCRSILPINVISPRNKIVQVFTEFTQTPTGPPSLDHPTGRWPKPGREWLKKSSQNGGLNRRFSYSKAGCWMVVLDQVLQINLGPKSSQPSSIVHPTTCWASGQGDFPCTQWFRASVTTIYPDLVAIVCMYIYIIIYIYFLNPYP